MTPVLCGDYGGITFELSLVVPPGCFGIRRQGRVVDHGRMDQLSEKYQAGDTVMVGEADWQALSKVPPRPTEERKER